MSHVLITGSKVITSNSKVVKRGGSLATLRELKQWYAARLETGYVNTNQVVTLTDKSGNGISATQATSTKRALYTTNVQNSLPSFEFDGTDDYYSTTPLTSPKNVSGVTLTAVVKKKSLTGTQYISNYTLSAGAVVRAQLVGNISGTGEIQGAGTRVDGGTVSFLRYTLNDLSTHIITSVIDFVTGTVRNYVDGVFVGESTVFDAGALCSNTNLTLSLIGAAAISTSFLNAHLMEYLRCDAPHTSAEVYNTYTLLKNIYAL